MSNRQRFENKVVIVTGAAQGIGRGVALQVASEGAQVVMADLSLMWKKFWLKLKRLAVMR